MLVTACISKQKMNTIEQEKMGRAGFEFVKQFEMDDVLKKFYEELKVLVEASAASGCRQREMLEQRVENEVRSNKDVG